MTSPTRITFSGHATSRMIRRGFTPSEVEQVVFSGEIIERYPDDTPYPSVLVLGFVQGRPIHVVTADRTDAAEKIVITVYEPDPTRWDATFRKRSGQ